MDHNQNEAYLQALHEHWMGEGYISTPDDYKCQEESLNGLFEQIWEII